MPIALLGQVNISALNVPQALVQIVPPQFLFNGVPTNVCGLVGTASWGPVNLPTTFGNYAQYVSIFGPTINRNNDIGGHVILASSQGAGYFCGVRVTDGTDLAASVTSPAAVAATGNFLFAANPLNNATITLNGSVWTFVNAITTGLQILIGATLQATMNAAVSTLAASLDAQTVKFLFATTLGTTLNLSAATPGTAGNSLTIAASLATPSGATLSGGLAATTGVTWTARYTGSLGNKVTVTYAKGAAALSTKVIVSCPGLSTEIFDNVGAGLSGNALWVAIVAAINSGSSTVRPASNIIVGTAGGSTGAPVLGSTLLSGGSDGATTITTPILLGVDSLPRTGMYALRNQGVAQFTLCDLSDVNAFSTQIAFGIDIGAYAIQATPASDTISNAATELSNNGIDSFVMKVVFGDWILWIDTVNGIPARLTSPAAVTIGLLGNLSPQNNTLNKPINGIVGTQSMILGKTYSYSDFQNLALARLDVITVDKTISNNYIHRLGINTSSNPVIMGDEYPRVTFFLAKSIQFIAAQYLGLTQTPTERLQAKTALQQFLMLAQTNGIIGTADGSQAFQVVLDNTNNTQATVALGYQFAYVKAIYLGIVRYFIVNLEGGSSVLISATPPGQ